MQQQAKVVLRVGVAGLAGEPALILGIDYLSAGRIVLDIESGQAWFRPAPD